MHFPSVSRGRTDMLCIWNFYRTENKSIHDFRENVVLQRSPGCEPFKLVKEWHQTPSAGLASSPPELTGKR